MWTTNFNKIFPHASSYQRSKSDTIRYEFNFYAVNPLNNDGKITLNFPFAVSSAEKCYSSVGLEDISEGRVYLKLIERLLFSKIMNNIF